MPWWYQNNVWYLRLVQSVFDSPTAQCALKVVRCQKWVRWKTSFLQASPWKCKTDINPEALIRTVLNWYWMLKLNIEIECWNLFWIELNEQICTMGYYFSQCKRSFWKVKYMQIFNYDVVSWNVRNWIS